jgi:hypothetical protein
MIWALNSRRAMPFNRVFHRHVVVVEKWAEVSGHLE